MWIASPSDEVTTVDLSGSAPFEKVAATSDIGP